MPGRTWRRTLYVVSLLANNIPDLDLLLTPLTAGKLGYLLHHRGFTHTLVLVPLEGLLPLAVVAWLARWRGWRWSPADWTWLAVVAVLGPGLHILMDYANSYGVHPFWPWNNAWYYGDTLFVVEPWLWLTLLPLLVPAVAARGVRALLGAIWLVVAAVVLWTPLVPGPMKALLLAWSAGLGALLWRLAPPWRLMAGAAATVGVVLAFAVAGAQSRAAARAAVRARFPGWQTTDLGVTPSPANPLCWRLLAVQVDDGATTLAVREAFVRPWPELVATCQLPALGREQGGTPLPPSTATTEPLDWQPGWSGPLGQLQGLWRTDCVAAAFLRFARVPVWQLVAGEARLSDARFGAPGRDGRESFADLVTPWPAGEATPCPERVPPWQPPLAALLDDKS